MVRSRNKRALNASRSVCWYNWAEQIRSVSLLLNYRFEWVLPGHGERAKPSPAQIREQLTRLGSDARLCA